MILKIDIDENENVTVEGNVNHSHGTKGGGTLKWQSQPGKGHKSWSVTFTNGSPFKDETTKFSGTNGAEGGLLKVNDGKTEKHYPYDVCCTDKDGNQYGDDPEIILWPTPTSR